MSDERDKTGRRPRIEGDVERTARARQPGFGRAASPIWHDPDGEGTPPPQEPPSPSSLRGFDSIPPPIREQLEMLSGGLNAVTRAVGKVWDARQDGARFDRIEAKLGTFASFATKYETLYDDFLGPAIKNLMSAVDELGRQMSRLSPQLETTSTLLTVVDDRLRTLEGDLRVQSAEFATARQTSAERYAATSARLAEQEQRIEQLERKERDRQVAAKAIAKSERRKTGGVSAAIATAVAAIVAAVSRVL